MGVTLLSLIFS